MYDSNVQALLEMGHLSRLPGVGAYTFGAYTFNCV